MPTDSITVLRHATAKVTKIWKADGTIEAGADGKYFIPKVALVGSIHAMSKLQSDLESDPYSCIIRGEYKGHEHSKRVEPIETKRNRAMRRKGLYYDPPHHWLCMDVDNFKTTKNPLVDPVGACDEFILTLPPCFHGVTYHFQLSSSAGHPSKPAGGLRVHIWFWLKTPRTSAQLLAWAVATGFKGDKALFDPIQLHFTAAPVFEDGVDNPVKVRSGLVQGDFGDEVALDIPEDILRSAGDGSAPASRLQKLQAARASDPIVDLLRDKGMVKGERRDGGLNIICPRHEYHTGDSGDSATIYYPAHTGGYVQGAFDCKHGHCRGGAQALFLDALGYDDLEGVFRAIVDGKSVQLLRGDSITPEPIEWLMLGWVALGKLILLAGSPGTGKTTLTMAMAAVVTTGGKWPDGTVCKVGSVVIWSGEDDPADTLVPRLLACHADMKQIHFVRDTVDHDGPRPFDPARDMPLLLSEVQRVGNVRLIVVDPIVSAVAGDSHKNAEVRRALQPLVDLAAKINAALIGITHFTKGTGGRDTTERVTGSLAFAALARLVLATARDADAGDFLLTRSKSNIGPDGGGWRYRMEQVDIAEHPGLVASRVVWGDTLEGSARELIGDAEDGESKDKQGGNTVDGWLRNLLTLQALPSSEVFTFGDKRGYSERRLQRALKKIGGISEKGGFQGHTWWRLPGSTIADAEGNPFDDGMEL